MNILKTPYYFYRFSRDIIFCLIKLGKYDKSWRFHALPIFEKHKYSKIEIGKKFVACSNPKNNSIGVFQKVMIKTTSTNARLIIANKVGISGAVVSCNDFIKIGNNVLIGSGVLITDNDAHPINPKLRDNNSKILQSAIIIEDDVFIGTRAIILKGVTIGTSSVIGAGAVVSKDVDPYMIVAGNPCKVVGDVRDKKYL